MKKVLLMALSLVLVAVLSVGATLAFLTDEESSVNVMTVGNVDIEQLEYERVTDANGNYVTDANGYKLQPYTQAKPALPAIYNEEGSPKWDETPMSWGAVGATGTSNVFDASMGNVVDKFVFVKNTGVFSAYVRTIVAIEEPEALANTPAIHINMNTGSSDTTYRFRDIGGVEIGGVRYYLIEMTYPVAVKAGETTPPSLMQVYLDPTLTNEQCALFGDTFDVLVVSQAVQANGFQKGAADALNKAFGEISVANHPWLDGVDLPVIVKSVEELDTALKAAGAAGSGDTEILITADIDASDFDWEPIKVDGYNGAGIVTIDGAGKTITGLSAPLFDGGFAGKSGIVIKNLTIADSTIESSSSLGGGAFIANADSMSVLSLENCHLINSTVDAPAARTGGLIGWCSGYAKLDDGPVKTYVTIKDCSVIDCEITGTSVGGIAGHPGASDYTYTFISNCVVMNNTLTSTHNGDWRVGDIVGTANNGHVTITNCSIGNNEKSQPAGGNKDASGTTYPGEEVGRFVPAGTGTLEISGTKVSVDSNSALDAALKNGATTILLAPGEYVIPASAQRKTLTLIGSGEDTVVNVVKVGTGGENCDYGFDGSTVVFDNLKLKTNSSTFIGYARLNATYNNCTFDGTYTLYGNSVFNDCTFNVTGDAYNLWTWGAPNVEFNRCTFNSDGKAIMLYGTENTNMTVNNCVFNDLGGLSSLKAAIEIGNDYNKSYALTVNNTTVNGYEINNEGINTGTTLWGNKNSMPTDKLNVVVNGVDVY